jgi:regulator of ribonuclease activity A
LLRQALEEQGKGRVLVVQGHGSRACALMGDMIAALGMNNGWSGVVINGMIRDVDAISKLDWGVMALGSNPAKSRKLGIGVRNKAIQFGGVHFELGAYIYCDEDGILVGSQKLHNL